MSNDPDDLGDVNVLERCDFCGRWADECNLDPCTERCSDCGDGIEDGEGYDGRCGPCADKFDREDELAGLEDAGERDLAVEWGGLDVPS